MPPFSMMLPESPALIEMAEAISQASGVARGGRFGPTHPNIGLLLRSFKSTRKLCVPSEGLLQRACRYRYRKLPQYGSIENDMVSGLC